MAARSPNGDLPMVAGFIVICRRSTEAPTVTAEPPDDRRRDTGGASAENLVISSGNRPVAQQSPGGGRQAPAGWLYDMVQGQENPAVSCRSRKIGIRQKSTSHRAIYVSWDVGFSLEWARELKGNWSNAKVTTEAAHAIWNWQLNFYFVSKTPLHGGRISFSIIRTKVQLWKRGCYRTGH